MKKKIQKPLIESELSESEDVSEVQAPKQVKKKTSALQILTKVDLKSQATNKRIKKKPVTSGKSSKKKIETQIKTVPKKQIKKGAKNEQSERSESENDDVKENFKPFQKKETPQADDPIRIFYETLLRQKPDSQIAMKYCIEYGVIDDVNEIKKIVRILENTKDRQKK